MSKYSSELIGDDLLVGASAIAGFLGWPERAVFYHLQRQQIPATKRGSTWISSKSRLQQHYCGSKDDAPSEVA